MTPRVLASAAALSVLAFARAGPASAACQFQKIAEVPVTMEGLRPTIMAKINGQDAKFLVDTGAFFGGVTADTAAKYGMKRSIAPFGMMVQGVGGVKRDVQAVAAQSFTFAGVGFHDTDFLLLGRIGGGGVAGNIGENLMGPFDVEYDFANGLIRYFKATGCAYDSNLAYWSAGLAVSRVSIIDPSSILLKVITNAKVDGHTIRVTFDSGSSLSVMSRPAASRAGIQVNSEGVVNGGISYGIYGKGLDSFLAPFGSFKIGDEEIKNTRLRVADIDLPASDMLLGADFFLSHRILISNSQKKVYFTYNGGPVFRLDQQQPARAVAAAAPTSPAESAEAATPGDGPKTAAEFARRASASAARRDFQPAIADYTRAIELEPDNARHYRDRALARLSARQPVLAMADLDAALKREPNDVETLMRRGELFLATRAPEKAREDFEAATRLAPDNSELPERIGTAFGRAGQFEPAIQQLNLWITAHPKSEDLPRVLSSRCFARAAWGKELDAALADCDAALRKNKVSEVMGNRGLVLLRMGKLDEAIAQYNAAVGLQPRYAPALYGRGLAELKKGDKAKGEADIAAAKAIAPGLAQQYQRYGLAPDAAPAASTS
ncbi:MAG TPA: aspartyl protease family protein [Phenylobacterium sp.]|nr:aspartyl protease family protein [Phenylobacterium sp.]